METMTKTCVSLVCFEPHPCLVLASKGSPEKCRYVHWDALNQGDKGTLKKKHRRARGDVAWRGSVMAEKNVRPMSGTDARPWVEQLSAKENEPLKTDILPCLANAFFEIPKGFNHQPFPSKGSSISQGEQSCMGS